jgi:hypothetical protein
MALVGYRQKVMAISAKITDIERMLRGAKPTKGNFQVAGEPKRKFSAATRKKMAAAQRARRSVERKAS